MGDVVKLDLNKYIQANNAVKSDGGNCVNTNSKNGFNDMLQSVSNRNERQSGQINKEIDKGECSDKTKVSKKDTESKDLKDVKKNETAGDVTNDEDVQLTDEQKQKLNKVKKILEELFSGTEDGDKKVDDLLGKISKLISKSDCSDVSKDDQDKVSDGILEAILSAMNIPNMQITQLLSKDSSSSDAISELKQDLSKLINADDNKAEDSKNVKLDFMSSFEDKDNVVKSSELKLNQMLTSNSQTDEEKLLLKIKSEISNIATKLSEKDNTSSDIVDGKNRLNLNVVNTVESKNDTLSQNSDGKQQNSSDLSQDDKFLNDLLGGSSNEDDKISKVTNLFGQFSLNNISKSAESVGNPTITKANFAGDIVKSLKYMENNNIKDLTIKITPNDLGEVVIKITSDGGIMKASITAANKEAYSLLSSNLQDLNNSLNSQNIKIQNVDINIYNGDTTFFSGNDSKENEAKRNSNKNGRINSIDSDGIEDVTVAQSNLYDESNINTLA